MYILKSSCDSKFFSVYQCFSVLLPFFLDIFYQWSRKMEEVREFELEFSDFVSFYSFHEVVYRCFVVVLIQKIESMIRFIDH
ncbi:hypothetical protein MSBRW_2090 [Methanosarcina barkeri str. Wiesmoor]|uniref:Uncharacterized protein n=1 Tax=Methanosarcina barkeri str. Wiesmoor TaxID=1434109 RepID=A0A0E3QMT8_METBA|nr:hypothetical protein MSBRW_2090 [Methanosarcina barkeri str. Wiesmoor]